MLVILFALPVYGGESMPLSMLSPVFENGSDIPATYTCEGEDVSPQLVFSGVPGGAKSLALIVDDPDAPDPAAPRMVWTHWVIYNLSPASGGLAEGVSALPAGTLEGMNDWQRSGYGGPCPPIGRHRYFFRLYALDNIMPDLHEPTSKLLQQAMTGHILAEAQLIGTYRKQR